MVTLMAVPAVTLPDGDRSIAAAGELCDCAPVGIRTMAANTAVSRPCRSNVTMDNVRFISRYSFFMTTGW